MRNFVRQMHPDRFFFVAVLSQTMISPFDEAEPWAEAVVFRYGQLILNRKFWPENEQRVAAPFFVWEPAHRQLRDTFSQIAVSPGLVFKELARQPAAVSGNYVSGSASRACNATTLGSLLPKALASALSAD